MEQSVQEVVEECAGETLPLAERLMLHNEAGEVDRVAGAEVECDLLVSNGTASVVEVKSHLKPALCGAHRRVADQGSAREPEHHKTGSAERLFVGDKP